MSNFSFPLESIEFLDCKKLDELGIIFETFVLLRLDKNKDDVIFQLKQSLSDLAKQHDEHLVTENLL